MRKPYLLQSVARARMTGETCISKRAVLVLLLLLLAILLASLLLLFLTHPVVHETLSVPYTQEAVRELNLTAGAHVSVWLWTAPPFSMRSAGGQVIIFYVTDPAQNNLGGYPLGVAGIGYFTPFTFVAQQAGVYVLHFHNSIGDGNARVGRYAAPAAGHGNRLGVAVRPSGQRNVCATPCPRETLLPF